MPDWGVPIGGNRNTSYGVANSVGATLTTGAANTKGSWVQLVAFTPHDAEGFWLFLRTGSGAQTYLLDVGTGDAGSETVILADVSVGGDTNWIQPVFIPLHIPALSRVALRALAGSATQTLEAGIILVGGTLGSTPSFNRAIRSGAMTSIDPLGTANVKGGWASLTPLGVPQAYRAILLQLDHNNNAAPTAAAWSIDVGFGAAGDPGVIFPNVVARTAAIQGQFCPRYVGPIPVNLNIGDGLFVRAASTTTDATDRLLRANVIFFA